MKKAYPMSLILVLFMGSACSKQKFEAEKAESNSKPPTEGLQYYNADDFKESGYVCFVKCESDTMAVATNQYVGLAATDEWHCFELARELDEQLQNYVPPTPKEPACPGCSHQADYDLDIDFDFDFDFDFEFDLGKYKRDYQRDYHDHHHTDSHDMASCEDEEAPVVEEPVQTCKDGKCTTTSSDSGTGVHACYAGPDGRVVCRNL